MANELHPSSPQDSTPAPQSVDTFRLLVDSVADYAIVMLDLDGGVISWNSGAEHIMGYPADEIIGRHCSCFYTSEDIAAGRPQLELAAALARGRYQAVSERVRRDGSAFWASVTITALYDASNSHIGYAAATRDLSERRHVETALRDSEARFRQLAESIHEVFWLTDPDKGEMVYISPAYETIWGRSCQSLYESPRDWLEAIHIDDRDRIMLAATNQATGTYDEKYRIVRPDGAVRWIRDRAFPVLDADGKLIRVAGVAEDITERLQLESQLRHSQKMESVGQLAGGIAHDFNNLLTVISGNSELMMWALEPDDPSVESLLQIRHACERAALLTRQLLVFSRQQVMEPKVLDLNAVVADTEAMLRRLLGEDIMLASVLDPTISRVKVDPGHLVQVMMNLALNARDSMPQGGRLTIQTSTVELEESYTRTHADVQPGHYVMLAMTDTGTGMSPEMLARIFEPFFTTKGMGKGSGLGLAVVHGIVTQSAGHVQVYSEIDHGTTFKIYFPCIDVAAETDRSPDRGSGPRGTETILLVEDEEAVRKLALLTLQSHGYTVLQAGNGAEALEILNGREEVIDLLMTDVVMPTMGGRELAETLRHRHEKLRVLYTSGYTDDAVVRHGILHTEVAFLQKPYTPLGMLRKVRQVLAGK